MSFRRLLVLAAVTAAVAVLPTSTGASAPESPTRAGGANWTLGGTPCRLIDVPAAAPVGAGTCPGVRPGAIVNTDVGQCTFNFLFAGSDGNRYIGTAGHCILAQGPIAGDVGEFTWAPGTGPVATDAAGQRVGEFAYAIQQDPKDFALIRLDPGVEASPQMCHFGGPTGINNDLTSSLVQLQYFGNGLGVGSVLPARTALAIGMPDPDHVFAQGITIPGDSGGGIISSDGRAVGVVVTLGAHLGALDLLLGGALDAGLMGITRLEPQLARASEVLGTGFLLYTAPQL
jgi:hypothetical protein